MEEYFNGLLKEVDQRMATTAPGMDGKEVIGVCREMVSYLKGKNRELKEYALAHPFAGDAKEILYFKYYKRVCQNACFDKLYSCNLLIINIEKPLKIRKFAF